MLYARLQQAESHGAVRREFFAEELKAARTAATAATPEPVFSAGPEGRGSRRAAPAPCEPRQSLSWRSRAVELAGEGLTSPQIARELEVPLGEVELVVALACPSRAR